MLMQCIEVAWAFDSLVAAAGDKEKRTITGGAIHEAEAIGIVKLGDLSDAVNVSTAACAGNGGNGSCGQVQLPNFEIVVVGDVGNFAIARDS